MSNHRPLAPAQLRDAVPLFAALGDETRMKLLLRLATHGPGSISSLSQRATVSRQAVTKHLVVLARAKLVRDERRGRQRIWRLQEPRLATAREYLERISLQWDDALERLRKHVER
jgi:DNA-binding transcriptional ArsR family regulator